MKKYIMICAIIPFFGFSQNYPVSEIPDSLLQNANVVKRFEEKKLIIKSPSKAILKHKRVYTILNEQGQWAAWYNNHYDKFHDLSDINGILYDATGKELKHIRKKDIVDRASDDGFSLITDARIKQFNLMHSSFPYTVEIEDEETYNGIYSFPKWTPYNNSNTSIQKTSFIIECQNNYEIRVKVLNCVEPKITIDKNQTKTYEWEFQNLKPLYYEIYSPPNHEILPTVLTGVTEFEYGGYKGNMKSWKDYGLFYKELIKDRDDLPVDIIEEVKRISSILKTDHEKVIAIFNYLQSHTRYINIALGIGGLQPLDAKFVAQKKYGDCKALSNYMVALLKQIGIKAHHVSIASGIENSKNLIESFPNHYSNHRICCVPLQNDTMWLECTSQTISPGYAGNFTGNRKALLIADDGGYLVSTPRYKPSDNKQLRNIKAVIDETGNLTCTINTKFTGQQQELQDDLIHEFTQKQKEDYLNKYIPLANYKIEKNDYKQTKGAIPVVDEILEVSAPNYATISGKRLFVVPNLINKQEGKLSTETPRKFDIDFLHNFIDADTVLITIPQGYAIEAMPKNIALKNKFGEFSASYSFEGNTIKYLRFYTRFSQRYPASDYIELAKFYEDMFKADRARMVFVKKE